jgi:DNA (cytosine-5)-methyltransferase 1
MSQCPRRPIVFADLFCGAGGATTGLLQATERTDTPIKYGVAINHWPVAIDTHSSNHPKIKHLCESIERVDPCEAVPCGKLDLLWASPECTHHSRARGGRPRQNQSRAGASHILTWLDKLYVRNVIIENVPEFETWGPLGADGHVIKSRRGECFHAFIDSLRARNYNVEWRILCAADYGDATMRRRLFLIARRKPNKIRWPEPTHRDGVEDDLFESFKPYRTMDEVLDLEDIGTAIHERKRKRFLLFQCHCGRNWSKMFAPDIVAKCKCGDTPMVQLVDLPLSPNTLSRIESGLEMFCGISFVDRKFPGALVTSFLIQTDQTGSNGNCVRHTSQPLGTIVTKQNIGLVNAFLVSTAHGKNSKTDAHRVKSINRPLPTMKCKGEWIVVNPFIITARGTSKSQLAATAQMTSQPIGTLTTSRHEALIQPFVISYYGKGDAYRTNKPMPTVMTKDRFALINIQTNERMELVIFYRLLKLKELAGAHSFPKGYKFCGTNTQAVAQVGNSNPVELTAALTACVLTQ